MRMGGKNPREIAIAIMDSKKHSDEPSDGGESEMPDLGEVMREFKTAIQHDSTDEACRAFRAMVEIVNSEHEEPESDDMSDY